MQEEDLRFLKRNTSDLKKVFLEFLEMKGKSDHNAVNS